MIFAQQEKWVNLFKAATMATSATASARADALGWSYFSVIAKMPTATATNSSAKWGVFTVYQGDTTAFTSATAVATGTTNSSATAGGFVIGAQNNTSDPCYLKVEGPLTCRYVFVSAQSADSHSTVSIDMRLTRPEQTPDTASEAGLATWYTVGSN